MYPLNPLQVSAVIVSYAGFHSIVQLAYHNYDLPWYSNASEHLPNKCAVDRVLYLLQVDETQEQREVRFPSQLL